MTPKARINYKLTQMNKELVKYNGMFPMPLEYYRKFRKIKRYLHLCKLFGVEV